MGAGRTGLAVTTSRYGRVTEGVGGPDVLVRRSCCELASTGFGMLADRSFGLKASVAAIRREGP